MKAELRPQQPTCVIGVGGTYLGLNYLAASINSDTHTGLECLHASIYSCCVWIRASRPGRANRMLTGVILVVKSCPGHSWLPQTQPHVSWRINVGYPALLSFSTTHPSRKERANALTSSASNCGCSIAGKCPPFGISVHLATRYSLST